MTVHELRELARYIPNCGSVGDLRRLADMLESEPGILRRFNASYQPETLSRIEDSYVPRAGDKRGAEHWRYRV